MGKVNFEHIITPSISVQGEYVEYCTNYTFMLPERVNH